MPPAMALTMARGTVTGLCVAPGGLCIFVANSALTKAVKHIAPGVISLCRQYVDSVFVRLYRS